MTSSLSPLSPDLPIATLHISCTCTECTTFLRPILPSRSHYPRNFSQSVFPAAAPTTSYDNSTPGWIDKLSLAAHDMHISIPAPATQRHGIANHQQRLGLITTTTNAETNIRSAFPKTPGTLRCSNTHCRTRLTISSGLVATSRLPEGPLCEEHEEHFFDAQEKFVREEMNSASPETAAISDNCDSHPRSGAGNWVWGSNYESRVGRSSLGSRTSSLASWEGDDADFTRGTSAFDSKLCW
jgi:hypothetical protein